jgi:hypothetical protein
MNLLHRWRNCADAFAGIMVLSEAAYNLSMMSRLAASTRIAECGKARQPIERVRDPGNIIFTNFGCEDRIGR